MGLVYTQVQISFIMVHLTVLSTARFQFSTPLRVELEGESSIPMAALRGIFAYPSPGPLDVVTAAIYFLLQLHNERQINMFPDMAPYTIGGVLAFRVRIVVTHA